MKLSAVPTARSISGLSDGELQNAIVRTREDLTRAISYLSSDNEGPSDPTRLQGRVQELTGQLQILEQEVIDRMLRHQATGLARLPDMPRESMMDAQRRELPDDVVQHHLLPHLADKDLAALCEAPGDMGRLARAEIVNMRKPLQGILPQDIFRNTLRLAQQKVAADNPGRSDLLPGRIYLEFASLLRERLSRESLDILWPLYQQVKGELQSVREGAQRRALSMLKNSLVYGLVRTVANEQDRIRNHAHLGLIANELWADRDIVLAAVQQGGYALGYASAELRADPDIVRAAVQQGGYALGCASAELRANRDIVRAAVQRHGWWLRDASAALRADPDIVRAAVQQNGYALQYASAALRADPDIVRAAVQQNGDALQFASDALQNDPDIVRAAVQQNGYALQFASDALQNDPDIVSAAVQQNGAALQYASAALQADPDIVRAAMQRDGGALRFASATWRAVRAFLRYAFHRAVGVFRLLRR